MNARKVVPILLIAGGVMMIMHHRVERLSGSEEGEERHPIGPHGPHGAWGKRVPPMFLKWHQLAHEQEAQAAAI